MKRKVTLVMIMMIIMSTLAACAGEKEQPAQEPQAQQEQKEEKEAISLPTEDRAGNEVVIPEKITKIISMSPSNTEILVDLGFGENLIAIDEYSADIEGIPADIPQFDMMNPDVEQLVALNPDIIYATGMSMANGNDPYKSIKDLGITVVYIPSSDSIEDIYKDIMFIADSLKVSVKGEKIVDDMKAKVNEYKEIGSKIENKKTVYFEIAGAPNLYSFGNGVFLNEMIEILGAENILKDEDKWLSVSNEVVVTKNPDIILTNVNYIENAVDEIKNRAGWENITAIKNNDVYYIDNDASSLANQNIIKALDEMAKAIYPEVYTK